MNEDELKAIDRRLAAMSERVDAVIEKESRGKPMPVLDFKPRGRRMPDARAIQHVNIARSPKARYVPQEPDLDELREEYISRVSRLPSLYEGSIAQIFADFERQFDEMAQAHRGRA